MGDGIISPGEHDHIAGTGSQRNRLTDALI
jgi:hypothetical protein